MTRRSVILVLIITILLVMVPSLISNSKTVHNPLIIEETTIDPTTNFFTQPEDKTPVNPSLDPDLPLSKTYQNKTYQKVAENDDLILFLHPISLGIAVYDKKAQYHWYSSYPEYESASYSAGVKNQIASGIHIECFETTSSELIEIGRYSSEVSERTVEIETNSDGCLIGLNFNKIGISFQVKIALDGRNLVTTFLKDSLKEVPIQIANYEKKYKLKSIAFFPYLGADNHQINAYAMIPDGSGALIRYTDEEYQTAYIKRIYGSDYGIQERSQLSAHLSNQHLVTMPIYGINHGYNQAAILAQITKGSGSSELHAYPYMYNNLNLNRTFFKYLARDRFLVFMATADQNAISLINSEVYPTDYEVQYTFLPKDQANYVGMAKAYRDSFALKKQTPGDIPLKTDFIAQDYKPGLLGKKYIAMTSYRNLKDIVTDLISQQVKNMEITYIGWNKNGYYDNLPLKPKVSRKLGGKKEFSKLMVFLEEKGIEIYSYQNPLATSKSPLSSPIIKRTNLQPFVYQFNSSLKTTGYHLNPGVLADNILKYKDDYRNLGINNLNLTYVGEAGYSYLYKGKEVYREQMLKIVEEEIKQLSTFKLGMNNPNSYLYPYINSFYSTPYESSRYAFVTDSIPLISLVLGGGVNLFAPYSNFISDSQIFALRLVEYNLYPSFILSQNPSYYLRYTNSEHIYTSEYAVWRDIIGNLYTHINEALKHVRGSTLMNHEYLQTGIAVVTYDNLVKIVVNYTNEPFSVGGKTVAPFNYLVIEGDS